MSGRQRPARQPAHSAAVAAKAQAEPTAPPHTAYANVALVLQGGGALGSYQAGVLEGLSEAGISPNWIAGISIGALNAAVIAGNPPERRVTQLRAFWEHICRQPWLPSAPFASLGEQATAWPDGLRRWVSQFEAARTLLEGQNGFFVPRPPLSVLPGLLGAAAPSGKPDASAVSYYDISDAGWTRPSNGYVSDWFGPRQSVWTGYGWSSSYHRGIDLAGGCGTEIYAASGGQVVYAGWNGGYGNFIEIDHGGGVHSAYGHQSAFAVGWGDWVGPGQVIGYVGTTGSSTGCHLHFEIRIDGSAIDPAEFLYNRGVAF
jgi:murein DD-endopeptidase MepM/ murein hydrolase activator NlpD